MKKSSLTVVCIAVAALFAVSCNLKVEFGKSPVRKVVAAMTLQEKVNLLVCADAGQTYSIPRLGIPSVVLSDGSGYRTSFPVSTMLAQSWNQQLVEEVGEAIGDEVKRNGADCLLLPALDLHSNPVVSGKTASAMVRGVQSNGIGATIKHNVLNGHHTTHGQYLKGFEIAVRESQPWAVMTRNGVLNDSILHCEWGFEGMVMTELADSSDAVAAIQAGNDLILPGSANHIKAIIEAVQNGNLDEKIIDRNVQNVLAFIERSPKMQGYEIQNDPDLEAHSRISRSIATEGMVLLKNNGALPLARNCKMIALYGTSSYNLYVAGTGNGNANNNHAVSLNEGLKAAGYKLEPSILSAYSRYVDSPQPLVRKPYQYRADAISSDIAIITIGRSFENENDFMLTDIEQGLISDVCDAFHSKGKKVIVVLNIGAPIETASWKSLPDAILLAGIPGQEAGYAITDILKGAVNPSGKLVDTYVIDYDCQKEQVSYPFGFGMSYTKFTYSEPQAKVVDGVVSLSVKITNTGSVAGKEAVQVYIEAPQENNNNQTKELKTYGKTALLQPGESQTLEFALPNYELAGFDLSTLTWQTVQGEYKTHFAASSQDLRCQALFNIPVSISYPAYGSLK
ncbi:MAG: glycoside hydrolase family 3 C-terminal domain-containing protein [Bacteroidaceae bacterium]|nr:glycoside hydrolase family 3 C-terminal domain-containing protein [Bacteroidaceae bacterium]